MNKITDINVENKIVLLRVDYNVPIKNGIIEDNNRIIESIKTIKYLMDKNSKIIILSHLGKIKTEEDKENNSLLIVKKELERLLNQNIYFSEYTRGKELEELVNNLQSKDILLIQNTRYEDIPNNLESSCDEELSKYWASLGDIFILDAFGSMHRCHASTYGISKYLPHALGFLVLKELEVLEEIKNNNEKVLIIGGSKVEDKLPLIKELIDNTSYILIGGSMCFTFLKARGFNVGKSFVDEEHIEEVNDLLLKYPNKIKLPIDIMCENTLKDVDAISIDDIGFDIGFKTIQEYKKYLNNRLVVWNGPMGKFEEEKYENGTKYLLEYLNTNKIKTVIAGGDTASACKKYNCDFYYISTGGGATLEYLSGNSFKTIEIMKKSNG